MVTGNGYQPLNNSGMGYTPNLGSAIQRPNMNNWYNPNNQPNMTNWYNPTTYSAPNQQIAQNLCNTYGVTPEEAMQQAKQFFKLP